MRKSVAGSMVILALSLAGIVAAPTAATARHEERVSHVLLLSVDGLHQSDLDWYVNHQPNSALARLARQGAQFTAARTPVPSDSFPGMTALATGGHPASTGIYYDDSYNRALLPAGTTNCAGGTPGAEVRYFEALDRDPLALDAGQGLAGLPDSILSMTSEPRTVIDRHSSRSTRRRAHRSTRTATCGSTRSSRSPVPPGCAPRGRTNIPPTSSSTARPGPAYRTSSRRRSTAMLRRPVRAATGRATTR
ncbi:MAG: hypothetical protein QOG15_2746 [Solirubrobacteraceae bacterium]|jgi:hypothetical protein|nr:hypothetical protein [Solirubrobacteraceae bacterium]